MRKYKEHPWKEDKVKCVILMKTHDKHGTEIEKSVLKVFVTKDVNKELSSEVIKKTLPIEKRFKYNLCPGIKMAIPRRVFVQILKNPEIETYFTTPTRGQANLLAYDNKTKIKKEEWFDPDNTSYVLYFKKGLLLHYEKK